jgi:iron complex outermembrane receptor protein
MFKRSKVASAALIALGGAFATAAVAQDAARVEITGSRILSVNAESPMPIQVLTAEDIAASGVTNVQDLLLKNPVFGVPTFSRTNSNFLTSSAGVSTIDLRNLGIQRTLVLINGRRVVSGLPGETAVDLNTIPTQFVERIEILTGGSSALYGSDAVAGVVNIILKKDYEGFNVDYKYGVSEKGDDKRHELALTWGATTANGKGNLMGHFGYSRQGAVMSADRSISAVDQASVGAFFTGDPADFFAVQRPFFSSFAPQGRFFFGPLTGTGAYSINRTFDANGNVIPFSTNGPAGDGVGATGFNRTAFRTIAVPTERFLFASKGSYEFSEGHRAFFEGTYAASQTKSELEPFPLDSLDVFPGSGGRLPAEFMVGNQIVRNPFVPDALYNQMVDTNGDGLRDYSFTRRMAEIGNRGNVADRDTFRMIVGVEGKLFKGWNYELFAGYGATKESQVSGGQVNVPSFRSALQAVADINDIDGDLNTTEPICLDAQARAEGCVPANIFGFNALSPAAVGYINAPGILATFTSQKMLGGVVTGEPFKMPAGPAGLAVGFEYRDEFSRSEFDPLQQAGLNAGNAIPRTEGSYDVQEVFAELRLPLLKDAPFAKALNLVGAVRGGKYSTVGNTLSWNAGFDWAINNMITVRGSSALSTRAPNINELFSPPSQTFPTGLVDPCIGVTATSTTPASAACRADPGIAANIAANGTFTLNQADQQGISGFNRGNPNLSEEEGKSWTLGLAFKPRGLGYLDNFALTLDYFNIKIDDAIVSTPRSFILSECYTGDPAFCQFITRRPTAVGANSAGSIDLIDSAVTNSGGLETEGVDVTLNFADRIGPGRFSAAMSYTHLMKGFVVPLPGAGKDHFAGEVGSPRDKWSLRLGYKWNAFAVNAAVTHIASSALDDQFLSDFGLARNSVKIPSKTYTDLGLSYQLTKAVQLYGGVDNLFDTKPPLIPSGLPGNDTGTETNAGTYDPIGRRYHVGVRAQF